MLVNSSIEEGSLFCYVSHVEISQTPTPPHCALSTIGKLSIPRGAWRLFHNVQTYGTTFMEYLKLKIQYNQN